MANIYDIAEIQAGDPLGFEKEKQQEALTHLVKYRNQKRMIDEINKAIKAAEKKANGSSVPAPPNILKPGDSNISVGGGKISLNPTAFQSYQADLNRKRIDRATSSRAQDNNQTRG